MKFDINTLQQIKAILFTKLTSDKDVKDIKHSLPVFKGVKADVQTIVTIEGEVFHDSFEVLLNRGEDNEQIVNPSIGWEKLACLALSKMNDATRESIVREYVDAKDAFNAAPVKKEVLDCALRIKGTAKKVVAGKLTAKVKVLQG